MQNNLIETEVSFHNTVTVAFTLSHATLRCGVVRFTPGMFCCTKSFAEGWRGKLGGHLTMTHDNI